MRGRRVPLKGFYKDSIKFLKGDLQGFYKGD